MQWENLQRIEWVENRPSAKLKSKKHRSPAVRPFVKLSACDLGVNLPKCFVPASPGRAAVLAPLGSKISVYLRLVVGV